MKRIFLLHILFLLVVPTIIGQTHNNRPTKYNQVRVHHVMSETEFNEILKNENVVIDFYAEWCGPCKRLAPLLEQLAIENPHILFFKVDSDAFKNLSNQFRIRGIPTLLLFKNGVKVGHMVGALNKQDYVNEFNKQFAQ